MRAQYKIVQRCNVLYQGPGTDFARPHGIIFLLGSEHMEDGGAAPYTVPHSTHYYAGARGSTF
jgi:hypothetical protein